MTFFNSCNEFYKTPFGAVPCGTPVTLRIAVPAHYGCTCPKLVLWADGGQRQLCDLMHERRDGETDFFTLTLTPDAVGLYFYFFDLYTDYRKLFCGALGEAFVTQGEGAAFQLTVYEADFTTPDHLKGGVLYQIFPDRFYEGRPNKELPFADRIYRNDKDGEPYFWPTDRPDGYLNMDYFGGDLAGIGQKLRYLADLGVTCLYLNPVFEAHSNHRYNTADYRKIDPLLGTNEEFAALCRIAKRFGIDIILDGVFSHTGSDSVYFNKEGRYPGGGAYHDLYSPYRTWYDFSPNYACGYRSWWGFETLPEVNENDPAYRTFICGEGGVIDYWLQLGAAGFRLDVADELPDDFIEEIRTAVKRNGTDKYLLGEVWEDATTKWSYGTRRTYLLGKGLDAVMNYPFRDAALAYVKGTDAKDVAHSILTVCAHYPKPALDTLMNFVSTHDTERALTAIADESSNGRDRYWQSSRRVSGPQYEHGLRLLRLAYALIFTLPGIPSVYYGDEICMQGYRDPFNRAYFNWHSTETRMQHTVAALAKARKCHAAFKDGSFHLMRAEGGVLHFERRTAQSTVAVCLNRTPATLHETLCGHATNIEPFSFAIVGNK